MEHNLNSYQIFVETLLFIDYDNDIFSAASFFDSRIFPILNKYNLSVDKSKYSNGVLDVVKRYVNSSAHIFSSGKTTIDKNKFDETKHLFEQEIKDTSFKRQRPT
jgi:hypothetical protein